MIVEVTLGDVLNQVRKQLSSDELHVAVTPHDIYKSEEDQSSKNLTYRIILQHHSRTLTTNEVNDMIDGMSASIEKDFSATRI